MNAFVLSQFSYCPLIWMCHSRSLNSQINKIHERGLRIVLNDNISSFEQLLKFTIHHRNLQFLAIEIYKSLNNLSSPLMSELFQVKDLTYNLRKGDILVTRNVKTKNYGTDSISYLAPKIWKLIPEVVRNSKPLNIFKYKIGSWVPEKCPCHLIYIQNLGYL